MTITVTREPPPIPHNAADTWWRWEVATRHGQTATGWHRGLKRDARRHAGNTLRRLNALHDDGAERAFDEHTRPAWRKKQAANNRRRFLYHAIRKHMPGERERQRDASRKYHREHREQINERHRQYYQKKKASIRAKAREKHRRGKAQ